MDNGRVIPSGPFYWDLVDGKGVVTKKMGGGCGCGACARLDCCGQQVSLVPFRLGLEASAALYQLLVGFR